MILGEKGRRLVKTTRETFTEEILISAPLASSTSMIKKVPAHLSVSLESREVEQFKDFSNFSVKSIFSNQSPIS